MEKLRKAGLYMSSLVPIRGNMVERYNKCLVHLGLEPTAHTELHIDSIGWSPEVAEEKGNNYYLNHGGANPYGIILSPLQQKKPVYFPYHSFDRELVDYFYSRNELTIKDLTSDSAIIIDLDQNIDSFYEPSDLIDYNHVTVGFRVLNDLDLEQERQNKLVEKMYQGNNSLNENLHTKLLASANKFGDLRTRKLKLEEVDYITTSFYTKAFGGVFVFRSENEKHLLVFESEEVMNAHNHNYTVAHISSPQLLPELQRRGYVKFDPLELDPERVERIAQLNFAQFVKGANHSVEEILSSKTLYLKYLNELSPKLKAFCTGPQRYLEKLAKGNEAQREYYITDEVFAAFHSPAKFEIANLLWILICRMQPCDPYLTYYYDKELFYEQFQTYDPSYQDWIINIIKEQIAKQENQNL